MGPLVVTDGSIGIRVISGSNYVLGHLIRDWLHLFGNRRVRTAYLETVHSLKLARKNLRGVGERPFHRAHDALEIVRLADDLQCIRFAHHLVERGLVRRR